MEDFKSAYIEKNYYIFPVKRDTKRPAIHDNLNQASIDAETISRWNTKFSSPNWAISLAKSGLVCVDVDVKHDGLSIWEKLLIDYNNGEEPDTLKAYSPSGGLHYVFKARPDTSYRGKIIKGIDVKFNGYILVEPSTNSKGIKYIWENLDKEPEYMPDWLAELTEKDSDHSMAPNRITKLGKDYISRCVRELKDVELDYHEWLQVGMAIHSARPDKTGLELFIAASQNSLSYEDGDEEKCKDKWKSFHEDGRITFRTLTHILREKGKEPPPLWLDEDKEAFRQAALADAEKKKRESKGFVAEGERFVNWSPENIVDWFNGSGFAFVESNLKAPIVKVSEGEGKLNIKSMDIAGFKNLTAPYFFTTMRFTSTGATKREYEYAFKTWLESYRRKSFREIVFDVNNTDENVLNLWRGINHEMIDEEPIFALKMIREALCNGNEEKSEWLLDWLAHIVQCPGEKSSTVPVLIGLQGTGKGLLNDHLMNGILGDLYTSITTSAELMARFNIHLAGKLLTHIDEATWRGNKTEDGILKNIIGSPTMSVEEKFGARFNIKNFSRYIISSNNKEAVALEIGNRRYCVIETNDDLANNLKYFAPIVEAIKEGDESKKFFNFLMKRDISKFNAHEILVNNYDGVESKINSEGVVSMFWYDLFYEEPRQILTGRLINKNRTYEAFLSYASEIKTHAKNLSRKYFWEKTKRLIPAVRFAKEGRSGVGDRSLLLTIPISSLAESYAKNCKIPMPENKLDETLYYEDFNIEAEAWYN